jgi:hypothetical protein
MKLAIMQPYLFPYIGYFQLIEAVDVFVIYDNIEYTKKGWINRNRILRNGQETTFSIPLERDSDFLHIRDRAIAADFKPKKLLNQLLEAYRRAPYFAQTAPLLEEIVLCEHGNLFHYLHYSLTRTCKHLKIRTPIKVSSDIAIDHELKNKDKVLALCAATRSKTYINPIGGVNLYSKEEFATNDVELQFLNSGPIEYSQFDNAFVPWLSIIDVMMFNSTDQIATMLNSCEHH